MAAASRPSTWRNRARLNSGPNQRSTNKTGTKHSVASDRHVAAAIWGGSPLLRLAKKLATVIAPSTGHRALGPRPIRTATPKPIAGQKTATNSDAASRPRPSFASKKRLSRPVRQARSYVSIAEQTHRRHAGLAACKWSIRHIEDTRGIPHDPYSTSARRLYRPSGRCAQIVSAMHSATRDCSPPLMGHSLPIYSALVPINVRFSNRPFRVKHFQTIAHGLALLFGIGTKALPPWDSRTRWNNLYRGLAVKRTAGPSGHANSPHPSSREGHHSTARWSSSFLLLDLILKRFMLQRRLVPGSMAPLLIHTRVFP